MHRIIASSLIALVIGACAPTVQESAPMPNSNTSAHMQDGLVTMPSPHSVSVTIDRLEAAVKSKGLNVFARVDHHKNAADMGLEIPPNTLLIFGSPKMGAPLMNASPTIGIDLPVKVLAYEQADGSVYLSYNDPAYLKSRHSVKGADGVFGKMSAAIANLSAHAVAP